MCTIISNPKKSIKFRDNGSPSPEVWVMGHPDAPKSVHKSYQLFDPVSPRYVRFGNPSIKEQGVRGLIPPKPDRLAPRDRTKKIIYYRSTVPFFASGSFNNYQPTWGGSNASSLVVFSSAIRHHRRKKFRSYGSLVTELLQNHENSSSAVTELINLIRSDPTYRGGNFLIQDKKQRYLVEFLPKALSRNYLHIQKVRGLVSRSNMANNLGFFWKANWDPTSDFNNQLQFLRSVNRWVLGKTETDLSALSLSHRVLEELDPKRVEQWYKLLVRRELDSYPFQVDETVEFPSFFSMCTHWNRGNNGTPEIYRRTKWLMEWDGRELLVRSGNPCRPFAMLKYNPKRVGQPKFGKRESKENKGNVDGFVPEDLTLETAVQLRNDLISS